MEIKKCSSSTCTHSGYEDLCPDCGCQMKKAFGVHDDRPNYSTTNQTHENDTSN